MRQPTNLFVVAIGVFGAIASIIALALVLNPDSILLKTSVTPEKAREKMGLFESKYGSSESLLREIGRVKDSVRDSENELRELRTQQNRYYGGKPFAGPKRLNDWRARALSLREEIAAKEGNLKDLKADYEMWLACKRTLRTTDKGGSQ